MSGSLWDSAREAQLRKLWVVGEGGNYLSAPEIARRMGISRGQVLGKARRLGLTRRADTPRAPKLRPALMVTEPSAQEPCVAHCEDEPKMSETIAGALRVRRDDLCCFPLGAPRTKEFRFCDMPLMPGKPYCAAHVAVAYMAWPERKAEVAYG